MTQGPVQCLQYATKSRVYSLFQYIIGDGILLRRDQSSVYSMPQSNKFIVYFSILSEMAYY